MTSQIVKQHQDRRKGEASRHPLVRPFLFSLTTTYFDLQINSLWPPLPSQLAPNHHNDDNRGDGAGLEMQMRLEPFRGFWWQKEMRGLETHLRLEISGMFLIYFI